MLRELRKASPRAWREDPKLQSVVESVRSNSTAIFGAKARPVSKQLEARKRPGPEPISDLHPARRHSPASPKWSFPPAWQSLSPESDGFRQMMRTEFDRIWLPNYSRLSKKSRGGQLEQARQKYDVYRQVAISFVGDHNLEGLREAWTALPARDQLHLASILLGCLIDGPRRALLMLSLDIELADDWGRRCECLCYLDMVYRDEIFADLYLKELFNKQIERVSRIWTWPPSSPIRWQFVVLLLQHNSPEHCENIIDTLFESLDSLPPRVILVMVDYLTSIGDADRALGLLSCIPSDQREEHKVRILDRCANLISIDTIEKSDSKGNFRALPTLIGLGLPINSKVHNRILERALELGVPDVAWEVFRFMEEREIQVNPYSYLLLLQDSFKRNNREKLDVIMSAIHGREDLYQYPYLVNHMLHIVRVVCTIDRKLPAEKSVSHLLAVYDRAYDRAPLVKLGIVDALPMDHTQRHKLERPPPAVLGFTIWAYVLCQCDERLVSALWFWIIHMIKQQDPSVLACAEHDVMWNGFIHFYARSPFYLRKAVDVLEAMFEHNLCTPTERTWSEVLCGFMKHGEEDTAAKIWQMMLARNVHLKEKRWTFLLENYDETQLADLVKSVLDERRMPAGVSRALSGPNSVAGTGNTRTHVDAALPSTQDCFDDNDENEMFKGEVFEEGDADSAYAGAKL